MNIALILAGGTGSRFGGAVPKQYIEVKGRPVISFCMKTFEEHPQIDAIQVVAEEEWRPLVQRWAGGKLRGFSAPGRNRQLSILNGLSDILRYAAQEDIVLIHDAARPLVSEELVTACLQGCLEHEGVMPAIFVKDTVYYGANGRIQSLLERSKVIAGQAPEAFRLGKYYQANQRLLPDQILSVYGSAEPAVMAGMDVCYINGEERNFKITTREDLERFQQALEPPGRNQ